MLTLRVFTENSRAAFVSVGPDYNRQMQLYQMWTSSENEKKNTGGLQYRLCTSYEGTKFAILRTVNASPGWNPRMAEGQTLESAQAITRNCCFKC